MSKDQDEIQGIDEQRDAMFESKTEQSEIAIEDDRSVMPWGMQLDSFCSLMHFSQFASAIIPPAGLVLPIVMWATQKDLHPDIDRHGKDILNWTISFHIYLIVAFLAIFFFVGIFMILGLVIVDVIFVIQGGIKASKREFYEYPMTIRFIK